MEAAIQNVSFISLVILGIFAGMLLSGGILTTYIYSYSRSRIHLATLIFSAVSLFYVVSELLVVIAWSINDPELGRQFHRLQGIASNCFIGMTPLIVGTMIELPPRLKKVNNAVIWIGLASVLVFTLAAFIVPDLFVSVEKKFEPAAGMGQRWVEVRGTTGILYRLRDLLFIPFILYGFFQLLRDFIVQRGSRYAIFPMIGISLIVFAGSADFLLFWVNTEALKIFLTFPTFLSFGVVSFAILSLVSVMKRFEDETVELDKIRKVESLGILAGGIAHDFNNLLTAVLGYISLIRAGGAGEDNGVYLAEAEQATLMARDLANQLLAFSRGGTPHKELIAPTPLIQESASCLSISEKVDINYRFAPDLHNVYADKTQLGQVVQNIVLNAVQAMPEGGSLSISAENVFLGPKLIHTLAAGKYVKISFSDTGSGVERDNLEKLFDPFFTTKQKGHGLGLTIALKIIQNHEGHISVSSKKGEGTVFTVYLPATAKALPPQQPQIREGGARGGKILYMEDEAIVAAVGKRMLSELGFTVDTCGKGEDALALFKNAQTAHEPYQFILLDIIIKDGMGGMETAEKLLRLDPSIIIVATSGYADENLVANFQSFGFSAFLPKPFMLKDLEDIAIQIAPLQ